MTAPIHKEALAAAGLPYPGHTEILADLGVHAMELLTPSHNNLVGLEGYGLVPGAHADFVLLHARNPADAIRLRAARLGVWRRGRLLASSPAPAAQLQLLGRPSSVNFL